MALYGGDVDCFLDVLSGTGRAQLSSAKRSLSLGQLVEDLEFLRQARLAS
jgi:hypothetical protein